MSALVFVMFALPTSDIVGRILCVLGVAFCYFVGAEWFRFTRHEVSDGPSLNAAAQSVQDIDQKMELLEDAKWQLNESAARYRDLLDQHQDMIIRLNADDALTFANRAFCRKFEIDYDQALGHPLADALTETVRRVSSLKGDERCELMETIDGERWIAWESRSISDDREQEIQYTGRDITDPYNAQRELEAARDEAQTANRSKSRFLASMSHEIRTPMNGILGMAKLLSDENLNKQQLTYVEAIDSSARNLLSIIDEILDFTKLEAGKIKLAPGHFSIEDTVLSVVELLAPAAHEKGIELAWSADAAACGEFCGDATRVRQVLLNLVSNAVKFTDQGGIRIRVTAEEPDGSPNQDKTKICLEVEDTGIGLSENDRRQLFSEFEQTDQALKRQAGGTGLGLAISKRLAKAMGGDLTVASTLGKGSRFVATMMLEPVFGVFSDPNYTWLRKPDDLHVLLAFDRSIERAALAETLSNAGIRVVECDFNQAMVVAENAKNNNTPFTRVVVDADVDQDRAKGLLQAMSRLAVECELPKRVVRGVVLVGISSRFALPSFRDLGFDAYMVRPVRPRTVFERLVSDKALNALPQAKPPKPDAEHDEDREILELRPLNFLLVEDNDINAMLVEHQLQRAGHSVERMGNGKSALACLEQNLSNDEDRFDVILMDVLLPEMDGLEATGKIRELFSAQGRDDARPPIIALTANAFEEDRKQCLDAGMDDYLAKPFDQDMLKDVLARCLPRAQKTA